VLPRDYTKQEGLIAEELSTLGLRYEQQVDVYPYTVDFFVSEIGLIIEADGIHGHLRKRDTKRDADLMKIFGIKNILHIKDNTKEGVKDTLWLALNKLPENLPLPDDGIPKHRPPF
jgi:very-short-patch-repair endonuclease